MRRPNYDKFPFVAVAGAESACQAGWEAIAARLHAAAAAFPLRCRLAIDCYPGVDVSEIRRELRTRLSPDVILEAESALWPPEKIDALVAPSLGDGDPVFGFLSKLELPAFFDPAKSTELRQQAAVWTSGLIVVVGVGARHLIDPDILVYADLSRWEAQLRFRRGETSNLGAVHQAGSAKQKYKRAFFVDWRVADGWKTPLLRKLDFLLDTHRAGEAKLVEGDALRQALRETTARPFRVVPFFDPAPWGGQWMKEVCDLDRSAPNYGWCFDCVPEENSLLLGFGRHRVEIPSSNLVFDQPLPLLGPAIHARFGAEFPIRFDFLDTVGGGNLSFQVHPLQDYMQRHFGLSYTQDESYYILDVSGDAGVYLGLRDDASRVEMTEALHAAQRGAGFDADRFANRWPARRHDHFLIPAGTVHCSGRDAMVLEISATPYIFTFKLWDWNRLGLDGKPRPIHLDHGLANIRWDRTTGWVKENLVNAIAPLARGPGWREERTGLHALQFIETRRHWFTGPVQHDTANTVNVLNLVEGEEVVVESPIDAFAPFTVHYAETFIVPAAVGRYTIRPAHGTTREYATMKAFVDSRRLSPQDRSG